MKLKDLIHKIEERVPTTSALSWDNVGLLVGDENQEIHKVYVALDATDEVVEDATEKGADLILTHHPLVFSGLKQVVASDFIGRRVMQMISSNVSCYAMHTNFDVEIMGNLAAKIMGLTEVEVLEPTLDDAGEAKGIGCVADITPTNLKALAKMCKETFAISSVKVFGEPEQKVSRIAVSPGSGKSEVNNAIAAGAQVLITGDIDHHTGIDAVAQNLAIIDAGHYGLEHIYVEYMKQFLQEIAPELIVEAAPAKEPFWVLS